MQNHRRLLPIIVITSLAFLLRVCGITWGLPNPLHYLSYHPDESIMLMHSVSTRFSTNGLNVFAGQFLPHFYNYGSLQLVLLNIWTTVYSTYVPTSGDFLRRLYLDYLAGRLLTVIMGTATVWVVWAFGRRVYGDLAGNLGAAFLAVTPLHVQQSHFMTVDVPSGFWVSLTLLWCAKAWADDPRYRGVFFAGCFAGLAAATKYNCALAILPVIVTVLQRSKAIEHRKPLQKIAELACAGSSAIVAYLLGCPGTVLEHSVFLHDFLFEAHHVSSQQELWFQGTGIGWWYILERNLNDGLGLPLLFASLMGAAYAVRKHQFGDIITLSFVFPYYLLVGAALSRYARYEIPLLLFLALWAGRLLTDMTGQESRWSKQLSLAFTVAVFAYTSLSTWLLIKPFVTEDPRDRAADWLLANVPSHENIGVPTDPWFWTPPYCPYFVLPGPGQWRATVLGADAAERTTVDPSQPFDSELLLAEKPPVVVMSEYEYFDRLRLHDRAALQYLSVLRRDYSPPLVFSDDHWLGGRRTIDGLPCQDLPHDMLYASPTVLIFKRVH